MFKIHEASNIGGIQIVSSEKLAVLTEGKQYIENSSNACDFLELQGQSVAFDADSLTYYVTHNTDNDDFEAIFSTAKGYKVYIEDDGYDGDVDDSAYDEHIFRMWAVSGDEYTVCSVIFTGAPVMSVYTNEYMSYEYGTGNIVLFNPADEEVNGLSVRTSAAYVKHNPNSDTYSVKLMKKSFEEEKKLSLLGLGKNNNWKLYKVSQNDGSLMRALLAYDIWNIMNEDSGAQRQCRFVELVVNHTYKGLYLLTPKLTRGYLGLDDNWTVEDAEDISETDISSLVDKMSASEIGRYVLFVQAVYAYSNVKDDFAIAYNSVDNDSCQWMIMPNRIEYALGGFDNKLNYLVYGDASRMMLTLDDMGISRQYWDNELSGLCAEEWTRLRQDKLSTENILLLMEKYKEYIVKTGLGKRCDGDWFGYHYDVLKKYMISRMEYLDTVLGV